MVSFQLTWSVGREQHRPQNPWAILGQSQEKASCSPCCTAVIFLEGFRLFLSQPDKRPSMFLWPFRPHEGSLCCSPERSYFFFFLVDVLKGNGRFCECAESNGQRFVTVKQTKRNDRNVPHTLGSGTNALCRVFRGSPVSLSRFLQQANKKLMKWSE